MSQHTLKIQDIQRKINHNKDLISGETKKINELFVRKEKADALITRIAEQIEKIEEEVFIYQQRINESNEELAEIKAIEAIEKVEEHRIKLEKLKTLAEDQIQEVEKTRQINLSKFTATSQAELQDEVEREVEDLINETTSISLKQVDDMKDKYDLENEEDIDYEI